MKVVKCAEFTQTWVKVGRILRNPKSIFFISSRWNLDGLHLTIMLMGRSYTVNFSEGRSGSRISVFNKRNEENKGEITMDKPVRAANSPYATPVEAGKTYYYCSCGRSKVQPFCDGSHAGTGFNPFKYEATESKNAYFCGCKETKNAPFCDGSHAV